MSRSKVWYWVHLGLAIATALVVIVSLVGLFTFNSMISNTLQGVVILLFVMPGALLVYGINQIILWRRKPRLIWTSDVVVIVIFTALAVVTLSTAFWYDGIILSFFSVPLLMVAGVVSTVFIAAGNSRAKSPALPATPIEPGTAPVAATLDELFPEAGTPYGPKS
jgi:hypothetical protein